MTGPLRGASRARPLRGRAVTRQGGFLVTDCLCKGGGELEIVERFLDDDEGLEAVARFLGGELEPERRVASLEV